MRSVLVGVLTCTLAGCATVSMVPGETTVETAMTEEQTALRAASEAYCTEVAEEGWITERGGLANLASILMNGRRGAPATPDGYSDRIGAATGMPAELVVRIAGDADSAREGLGEVIAEAEKVRESGAGISRSDVTSFERALVRAQRAQREFATAVDILAERGADTQPAAMAVDGFAGEIDSARRLADELLERYAGTGTSAS